MKSFKQTLVYLNYVSLPILAIPFIFEIDQTYALANWFGNIALIFFCLSLTPGIMKRLQLGGMFKKTQIYLMFGRRQLGLLTFVYALIHYVWHQIYPIYEFGALPAFTPFRAVGALAFFSFTLMAITSNNFSVKLLKKNWARLHKLAYFAAFALFLHVALVSNIWQAILIGIFLALEIISYLATFIRRKAY